MKRRTSLVKDSLRGSLVLGILLVAMTLHAQVNSLLKDGNKAYKEKKYAQAQQSYEKALEKQKDSYDANFNKGDALFQEKKYKEAESSFQQAINLAKNKREKEEGYYNLGNSYLQQEDLDQSISAYKNALKLKPDDLYAKNNLSVALAKRKKKQEQQQRMAGGQDKKQGTQGEKNKPNPAQNQPGNGQKKDMPTITDKANEDQTGITKQEAEQIMDALKNNEERIRQRMYDRRRKPDHRTPEKPW